MYSWILVVDVVQLHIFMFLAMCCDVRCDVLVRRCFVPLYFCLFC